MEGRGRMRRYSPMECDELRELDRDVELPPMLGGLELLGDIIGLIESEYEPVMQGRTRDIGWGLGGRRNADISANTFPASPCIPEPLIESWTLSWSG